MVSYPRRQQYRRMVRAGGTATGSVAATLLALALASARALWVAATLVFLAVGSAFYALSLANRSRIGARSEGEVRRVLRALQAEGWRVRHALCWRGRGDIDSVAIAPSGLAFAIEMKTRTYEGRHLAVIQHRLRGWGHDAEDGVVWAPCRFRASSVRAAFSAGSAACWWSRSSC